MRSRNWLSALLLLLPACGQQQAEPVAEPPVAEPAEEAPRVTAISLEESERRVAAAKTALKASLKGDGEPIHSAEVHVFGVTHDGEHFTTTARTESAQRAESGAVKAKIATVISEWQVTADGGVKNLSHHTASSTALDTGSPPWFRDRTLDLLGDAPAFRDHLAHGLDHWLPKIEAAHGFDAFIRNGMALGDANGDGRDDLYICQPGGLPNRLFIQNDDGGLVEIADSPARILDHTSSALFVDLDNDGDQDLVIATPVGITLLENTGNARYESRGELLTDGADCHALSAADYNLDGKLDLFITFALGTRFEDEEDTAFRFHDARDGGYNQLFRGDGDWSFSEVTALVGLAEGNDRHSLAASWEDYDLDGDPDLYIANDYGPNQLYRNDRNAAGKHRFTEIAAQAGVQDIGAGMSVSWADYDRDGRFDLYVGNMFSNAGKRMTGLAGFMNGTDEELRAIYRRFAKGNTLFRQLPDGGFATQDATTEMGRWAWSSLFADLDNDGWQDLFVANGYISGPQTEDL